jgi:signal transduction histidine kinase
VENRIHAINGSITFDIETNKGFKAKIAIPK